MFRSNSSIGARVEAGDLSLFEVISSQTTKLDRISLLALHAAARRVWTAFSYLEIGSHLGGSLQALIADPACETVFSIDSRPRSFGDERGIVSRYPGNSTERMLDHLRKVPGNDLKKITTFECTTSEMAPESISSKPHLCLIDAEHTDAATLRDANFCLAVVHPEGCIAFHDANVVYHGIAEFIALLENAGRKFTAYLLPDAVFVIELGGGRLRQEPSIQRTLEESWRGYVFALEMNAWYRAVLNKPIFKLLRRTRFVRRIFVVKGLNAQPI